MDLTPGLKAGIVGAFGFIGGELARRDPKMTGLIFLIVEVAGQIFHHYNALSNKYRMVLHLVEGIAAGAAMYHFNLISTLAQGAITTAAVFVASFLSSGFGGLRYKLET